MSRTARGTPTRPVLPLLALLLGAPSVAEADTVHVSNGDVLTGTVKGLTDGKLVLDTEYAGEVKIDRAQVVGVETAAPFTVRWADGRETVGRLTVDASGGIEVVPSATPEEVHGEGPAPEATSEPGVTTGETQPTPVDMATIASIQPLTPYYRYEGNFNLGLNVARGNTDTTEIHADGQIAPSFGRNTISLAGQVNRSEADGVTNASNWRLRAAYDRVFGARRRWYSTVFNTYENDDLADLNLRTTAGAGVGYKFFDQRPTLLRLSVGPAYVNEDFKEAFDRTFLALR